MCYAGVFVAGNANVGHGDSANLEKEEVEVAGSEGKICCCLA